MPIDTKIFNHRVLRSYDVVIAVVFCGFMGFISVSHGMAYFSEATAPSHLPQTEKPRVMAGTSQVLQTIREANLFGAETADDTVQPTISTVFELHGVMVAEESSRSYAILAADGKDHIYKRNDSLPDGSVLETIAADHIIVSKAGAQSSILLKKNGLP